MFVIPNTANSSPMSMAEKWVARCKGKAAPAVSSGVRTDADVGKTCASVCAPRHAQRDPDRRAGCHLVSAIRPGQRPRAGREHCHAAVRASLERPAVALHTRGLRIDGVTLPSWGQHHAQQLIEVLLVPNAHKYPGALPAALRS